MPVINETWQQLSPTKRDMLVALSFRHPEPMTNADLAAATGRSTGRVSEQRGGLELLDLVTSTRDGREIDIRLTDEGHALVRDLIAVASEADA
jgi:DNA-binding MarR family transcriptional regulator